MSSSVRSRTEAIDEFAHHKLTPEQWETFAKTLRYVSSKAGPEVLAEAVADAEKQLGEDVRRLHYLSVPPKAAIDVISLSRRRSWSSVRGS